MSPSSAAAWRRGWQARHGVLIVVMIGLALAGWALTTGAGATDDTAESTGVSVVGQSDLGGGGPNGHVDVLGDVAFVGHGTNGGFAAQWNKTPTCTESDAPPSTVKVVSLADPGNPAVISKITLPPNTVGRDVAALDVEKKSTGNVFTGDLLAVAVEACQFALNGLGGVQFYDVSDPSKPVLLSYHDHFPSTREVSLVQRDGGRVLALAAAQGTGVQVLDVTTPAVPRQTSEFEMAFTFSDQECRPFRVGAQGVSVNADGTRAYAAWQDDGLYTLDISNPDATPAVLSTATYDPGDEGNQLRYVPNDAETLALATDEDLHPGDTSLTVKKGESAKIVEPGGDQAGVFRGCEAIWGGPLYRRATPKVTADVVNVDHGCDPANYEGKDVTGKIVLTERGGQSDESAGPCTFDERARRADERGAAAVLVSNTVVDHHAEGGEGRLFSPDSAEPVDARVSIPVTMITQEAGDALRESLANDPKTVATLADEADTWGALRVFDLDGSSPAQVANVTTDNTTELPGTEDLYHAATATWADDQALVAWMSDGLRVVDLSNPSSPQFRASFVPSAAQSATGDYPQVPLVVDIERIDERRFVATDINAGLFVLDVVLEKDDCKDGGWQRYGFSNQGECVDLFDDEDND